MLSRVALPSGNKNYSFGFNGQMMNNDVKGGLGNSYTAQFWEYDSRIGRRWNLDPKSTVGISKYSTFANTPIIYSDPLGDTTGYFSNKNELLLTTYEKGYNRIMIVNDDKVEAVRKYAQKNQAYIEKNKANINNFHSIDEDFKRKSYGVVYDLNSFEKFYETYQFTGEVRAFNNGILSTAYDINLNGKKIDRGELIKYISSLKLGPEYVASIEMKNGLATVGDDVVTDLDLVSASPGARKSHIHNHPPLIIDLSFKYKFKTNINGKVTENIGYTYLRLPELHIGVDAPDQGKANYNSLRSAVVNGGRIDLYNGIPEQTIHFNRKTRKYEF
jgi:hypothetical protein